MVERFASNAHSKTYVLTFCCYNITITMLPKSAKHHILGAWEQKEINNVSVVRRPQSDPVHVRAVSHLL